MFEQTQVTPHNTNIIADQEVRVIPGDLTLPPPALLWEWLSYIYETTGEWWRPPSLNNPARTPVEPKPAPIVSVKEFQNYSRSLQPANFPPKPVKTSPVKSNSARTGFDYRASCYYKEADRLLEEASSSKGVVNNYAECRLVLAFIIAWSRFSLFEDLTVDGARWMALSFSKAACELKMRASTFKTCLDELENQRLLKLVNLSEGFLSVSTLSELQRRRANLTGEAALLFSAHFFQKHTLLYLLPVTLDPALPVFNPFGESLAGTGKTSEVVSTAGNGLESLSRSFQNASCKNESNNENDEISFFEEVNEAKIATKDASFMSYSTPGKQDSVLESLNTQEQSIYKFITLEASFEGFCRMEDGRETLDDWEALKFAGNGRYTLVEVITRYRQVKEVWESKGSCHNPLALLHWTLTNDVDPRRGKLKPNKPAVTNKPSFSQPTGKRLPYEAPKADVPKARPQLSYQKRMFSHNDQASGTASGEVLPTPESPKIFEASDEIKEPEKLWKVIFEDLTGRFQLSSSKLALLQDATLRFKMNDASQVEVALRSIWEERQLDGSTRHLINLALRQRLGHGLEVTFISK